MTETGSHHEVHSELSRDLNLFHITMMGLGMMIGAGVFVGIGLCMSKAGPGGLLLTFAFNGLIALFSAMSFAELASAIPRAGGVYNYARIAFGRPASFISGWMEWLAASAAGGFYAIVLATYTLDFLAGMGWVAEVPDHPDWRVKLFAVCAALAFVYVNYRGSSETGKLGALFTIGQMIFVVGIGLIGFTTFLFHPERIENFQPFLGGGNWLNLLGSMGIIYVAFEGFEVIAQAGDETIDPKQNIPKGILYSVFFVTLTYLLVAFATIVAVPSDAPVLDGHPVWRWIGSYRALGFGKAVDVLMRGWGAVVVTLAVIFSATSALNATIYSATRTAYALGRDGMLPPLFKAIHRKTKTPHKSLLITSLIVVSVTLSLDPESASATASTMFLLLFFVVNACVIRIRNNMADELTYGYLMPLFPVFPILAIIIQFGMAWGILQESALSIIIAIAWVALGSAAFILYGRKHAIVTDDEILVIEEEEPPPANKFRVMVSIANPANALALVKNTYKICKAKNAGVELLHMVPVPDQVSLTDAEKYMDEGKEGATELMLYLNTAFDVSSTIRYCRNIARGIVSAIRQRKADMLVMGWHGKKNSTLFALGSTIDPIIERSPCDVVIMKDCDKGEFEKVVVPLSGGPNSALALELASILVKPGGEVTALFVESHGRDFAIDEFIAKQAENLRVPLSSVTPLSVKSDDIVGAILDQASEHDLVVLGASRNSMLGQIFHASLPEKVAGNCHKPLVMASASRGLHSWLRRWF